jgi:single-stranded DNA-binding protein
MNAVHLSGAIGQYGVKIAYTEQAKPQTSFTLIVEEPGREGATFKTFVPICIVGPQAEHYAEILEAGDLVMVSGKLQYKSGRTKESGKLLVTCFAVERLASAVVSSNN